MREGSLKSVDRSEGILARGITERLETGDEQGTVFRETETRPRRFDPTGEFEGVECRNREYVGQVGFERRTNERRGGDHHIEHLERSYPHLWEHRRFPPHEGDIHPIRRQPVIDAGPH
jgi:hypothetical protein